MSVLYLLEPQTMVHKEGGRLVIRKGKDTLHSVHLFRLDQVVVAGSVTLTPAAIKSLLSEGVDTVFMGRNGRYYGRLQGPEGKNIPLRKEQFLRFSDREFALRTAKEMVKGKLKNQRALLQRIQRNQKKLDLEREIAVLSRLWRSADESQNLEELMGYEGQGAAAYFPAWGKGLKAGHWTFKGRTRRPPRDPVNALLSLGYTFLLHNVASAASLVGLDLYYGGLHSMDYGRPSLVLDLMEEWRPVLIDSLVLSIFNLGVLEPRDFTNKPHGGREAGNEHNEASIENGVYLASTGWRKFITQFERRMATEVSFHLDDLKRSSRDCILAQVRHFVRYLKGEDKTYRPVPIR